MISKDKKYTLEDGSEFKIYEIYDDRIHGAYKSGNNWIMLSVPISDNGLIEISPYADLKIDDKVLVWDTNPNDKLKRHFSGLDEDGKPTAWYDGKTSFSAECKSIWLHCIKYEENNDN